MALLPGDPREAKHLHVEVQDHEALSQSKILQSHLCGFTLHSISISPTIIDGVNYCLGSTLSGSILDGFLSGDTALKKDTSLKKLFPQFKVCEHRVVMLHIHQNMTVSLLIYIDHASKNSTPISQRFTFKAKYKSRTKTPINSRNSLFLVLIINVLNNYVLKSQKWFCKIKTVIEVVTEKPSLQHNNAVDCSLFTDTNCLHSFERLVINNSILIEEHISDFRKMLQNNLDKSKSVF